MTKLTFDDLINRAITGKVISVDTSGDQPVVKFSVAMKDSGQPLVGLRQFSLHLGQLKPGANGTPSYWQNYIADGLPLSAIPANVNRGSTTPVAPTNPTVDAPDLYNADGTLKAAGYKVVDGKDGTYTVTFGAKIKQNVKVPYDASLTHRIVVGVRSIAAPTYQPGGFFGPINPMSGAVVSQFTNTNGTNLIADFKPSTSGAGVIQVDSKGVQTFSRDNVTIAACNQCHYKIEYGFPRGNNTSGHFGSRPDTKTCVMCHTPQNTSGKGDFTVFIHKLHMGEELPVQEAEFWDPTGFYNEVTYPQDVRNCVMCHKGTTTDNYKQASRKACGACHNNIDFTTGANHEGRAQSDDSKCALCHDASSIPLDHPTVAAPDPNNIYLGGTNGNTNASYVAAVGSVPTGAAKITYSVSSVTRLANGNPQIVFKFQKDGTDVVFNTYPAKAELMDNFVGSPSVYFAWGVPQDGKTVPADYNASASSYIKNLWRGDGKDMKGAALSAAAVGTLTGPVGGYYTATLTGAFVPANATMLTGGVGYTYSLSSTPPLVQTNLAAYPYTPNPSTINAGVGGKGGLAVPPPNVWRVATGFSGRRVIVDNAKCNACHGALGVKPTFHAGQRNDAPTCTFCHNTTRTNSGWPVNIAYDVHGIHGGALRQNKFSWEATAGAKYWEIGYPGLLKNCEQCHVAGMYDFSASAYTANSGAVVGNMLNTTAAYGTINAAGFVVITGNETITSTSSVISPFVTPGTNYGAQFQFNANTGAITGGDDTNLVLSPISSACSGCHDSATARTHMQQNGGTVFGTRAEAKSKTETCLVCHGPANNALFNDTVPAIKTVHRWW